MPRSKIKVFKKRKGKYYPRKCIDASEQDGVSKLESQNNSNVSATERKFGDLDDSYSQHAENGSNNFIMELNILISIFKTCVKCSICDCFGLSLSVNSIAGLAQKFELSCNNCEFKINFMNSTTHQSENQDYYSLNTRFIYALRSIGKGADSGRLFCAIMNLPQPPTKFGKYNKMILNGVKTICNTTMKKAVEENNGEENIGVALDGSWQKRGFSSLNGVVTATSIDTGKVIDVEVLSKYCTCKNKKAHEENCKRNFSGYSGKMELDGVTSIYQRSLKTYGVRYVKYLGDGDSKAFKGSWKPYSSPC